MKVITSTRNPLFQAAYRLLTTKERRKQPTFLVRGARLVAIALQQGRVKRIFASTQTINNYRSCVGVQLIALSPKLLAKFKTNTTADQTVVAVATMTAPKLKWDGNILVLDGVQDPGNVGSLIRSACQFGFKTVLLTATAVSVDHPLVISASQGAWFWVRIDKINRSDLQLVLKKNNYTIINTDLNQPPNLALQYVQYLVTPLALILGSEGQGVDRSWQTRTHYNVHIPVDRFPLALNVAVSGGIIMQTWWQ